MTEVQGLDLGDGAIEARASARGRRVMRTPMREAAREPMREAPRGGVVTGRNGEILTRRRRDDVDPFDIPREMVPDGWTYQWNVVSVTGNSDVVLDQGMGMYENGWRPVPAERHPGMFVPRGTTGAIIRGGLRLEERPKALTDEAIAEQEGRARRLLRDQTESTMGRLKKNMADGMEMSGKYRGTGGEMKMQIDPGLDVPQPGNYELAEPGE